MLRRIGPATVTEADMLRNSDLRLGHASCHLPQSVRKAGLKSESPVQA